MKNESLDIYLEYSKKHDKYITRLMSLSSKKAIEKAKNEFQAVANDYIERLKDAPVGAHYIKNIKSDISTINENF